MYLLNKTVNGFSIQFNSHFAKIEMKNKTKFKNKKIEDDFAVFFSSYIKIGKILENQGK